MMSMYKRINKLLGTKYKSDSEINWWDIVSNYKLSENIIREFKNNVDWSYLSYYQKLSESFIREFRYYVDWDGISSEQILSESFIREFKNEVDWINISKSQLLSWNFILEFEDWVDWGFISKHQPFINPNYERIDKNLLISNKLYQLYQQTKDRGWFVGYVNRNTNIFYLYESSFIVIKSRIYWKNLITTDKIKDYEPLRNIKYV